MALSSPAAAQLYEPYQPVNADLANDDVSIRNPPEFHPIGGRLGDFFLYPRLSIQTAYTDNVLGTEASKRGDEFAIVRGDVQLVSDWSRHKFELLAYAQGRGDLNVTSENTAAYGAAFNGRYDFGKNSSVDVNFHADKQPEDRLSIDNTIFTYKPVNYLILDGDIRAKKQLNALTLQGGFEVVKLSYDNAFGALGLIDETVNDNTRMLYQGSLRYDLTHSTALIFAGQYDTVDYRISTLGDRNSAGYRLEGGIGVRISHAIVGDIRIGYLHRNNANPIYRNLSGISFFSNITWTLTRLLTLHLIANRDIENSVTLLSPGNLRSTGQIKASYEILRQLTVTTAFRYSQISAIGINGSNIEKEATLQVLYRLNRQLSLTANYRYFDRNAGLYQPVEGSLVSLGLALTL